MNPKRIALTAVTALVAICLLAPVAQADVFLSDSEGVLANGAEITATSQNAVFTRSDGSIFDCTSIALDLELIEEGTEHLELEQTTPLTTSGCQLNREALELPNLALTTDDGTIGVGEENILTIGTSGTAETNATFVWTVFGGPFTHESHSGVLAAACSFEGTAHFAASDRTGDELAVESSTFSGPCGEVAMDADFTLKTANDDPVAIHYGEEEPPTPAVWLSGSEGVLSTEAEITATSEDFVMTRPDEARVECEELTFHLALVDPGTKHLELEQVEGSATSKGCLLNREALELANLPMTIQDGTVAAGEEGAMTVDTDGAVASSVTFKGEFFTDAEHKTKIAECHFGGSLNLQSTKSGSDELVIESSSLDGGPCTKGAIDGKVTLETADGEPVSVNY